MSQFNENFAFQQNYYDQIKQILKNNAFVFIKVRVATDAEDMRAATDFVVEIEGGEIAVRIRRSNCSFRDLTIRTRSRCGAKTELHKIKEGFARYYLYCWTSDENQITEYIIVDLNKLRDSELLNNHEVKRNSDGTEFAIIAISALDEAKCLLVNKCGI